MRLLIADDEADIRRALVALLQKNNYTVDETDNGSDAYLYASSGQYDGLILDIMMPGMDGIEVLTRLRKEQNFVPVLLLTAKSEVEDRVRGLDAGADDYLPKPFSVSELLARVRAMLRRREPYQTENLSISDLTLDSASFELVCRDQRLQLSSREYQIMELLMRSPRTIVTSETLISQVWGWDTEVSVNNVWVYISNLRKKLQKLETHVVIRAVRGVGYCLEDQSC